jgi:hypothetical protein
MNGWQLLVLGPRKGEALAAQKYKYVGKRVEQDADAAACLSMPGVAPGLGTSPPWKPVLPQP